MSQPDGSYPRLNGALLGSGKYSGMIVSLVGKFGGSAAAAGGGTTPEQFACCDGATVQLDLQQAEISHIPQGTVVEVVGQVQSPNQVVLFVVRELTPDTDLETYNKMLAVQHNPKFAHYFTAAGDGMVTN